VDVFYLYPIPLSFYITIFPLHDPLPFLDPMCFRYPPLFLCMVVTLFQFSCTSSKQEAGTENDRPNIIWIMTDDHSYQTLSAYDDRFIQTPNMDRIAEEGVKFTNSFVGN